MTYEWVKVVHLLAVISWMAGLLYLPRLMVYHADAGKGGELSETLKVMERRLLKAIMTPAMIVSWVFGIWLGALQGLWSELPFWFVLKIILVLAMSGAHFWLAGQVKIFAADKNVMAARAFRFINEVPTLLMIGIICLVVVKPFL
ncbi:CopD family protein [Anderseniella sp. Alg231-50]|uniref:CopD family protein n=1 Tax=Anderseniella sp. Alg231-50 TaxID=1922226 RepID=UPI000D54B9F3